MKDIRIIGYPKQYDVTIVSRRREIEYGVFREISR